MPVTVLGVQIQDKQSTVNYTPQQDAGIRTFRIFESTNQVGGAVNPVVMMDEKLRWQQAEFNKDIVNAVDNAGYRDFGQGGAKKTGQKGINASQWDTLKGTDYKNTEMIGVMLAKLTSGTDVTWVVSASPNMLWVSGKQEQDKKGTAGKKGKDIDEEDEKKPKSPPGTYEDHLSSATKKGKGNEGGQIHFEQFMAAQLLALLNHIQSIAKTTKKAFDPKKVSIDADLYLSGKNLLCPGCVGTWKSLGEKVAKADYRSL